MDMMLWNILLTLIIPAVVWYIKTLHDEQKRLQILISKTREEYMRRDDHSIETDRIIEALRRLEDKIDRIGERK